MQVPWLTPPISSAKGPSALSLPGLQCEALTRDEIQELPELFAAFAMRAKDLGFSGVQVHAAHGFLLSQFLSPLFNKRTDEYGGSIQNRIRLLLLVIAQVRKAVGPHFAIAIKLNATDQLEGGLNEQDSLEVVSALDKTGIDLIDISGGTYFPGAKSASDNAGAGPYFLKFATKARQRTSKPLMLTGGFKTLAQAQSAIAGGNIDVVGIARALVLNPDLANDWQQNISTEPTFPRFSAAPEGGITAWYTLQLTRLAEDHDDQMGQDLEQILKVYNERDSQRAARWNKHFASK